MPSILMTNLYLVSNTGSELHTVEIASYLSKNGWDVTCFCLVCAEPILGLLRRNGIRVIDLAHMNELENSYDILLAQHRVASECIWNHENTSFGKVIISILGLSSVTKHEDLPYFFEKADLIVFISEEALEAAEDAHGQLNVPKMVVPNYFTEEFEDIPARTLPSSPSRIAVISNHIVSELAELELIASERNIRVDYFGIERTSASITPELISSYDVIVTIGRTVPAALSLGIPVYCYDHFGGPGFITQYNFDESLRFNFSGRNRPTRRDAKAIVDDIVSGWTNAITSSEKLQTFAREQLCFRTLMDKFESTITSLVPRAAHGPRAVSSSAVYSNLLECLEVRDQQLKTCRVGQFFYVPGSQPENGPSEDRSVKFLYRLNTEIEICVDEFTSSDDQVICRLDPMDGEACVCPKSPEGVVSSNCAIESPSIGRIFLTNDPIFVVTPCKKLSFTASTIDDTAYRLVSREIKYGDERNNEPEGGLSLLNDRCERLPHKTDSKIEESMTECDSFTSGVHTIRSGLKGVLMLCHKRLGRHWRRRFSA